MRKKGLFFIVLLLLSTFALTAQKKIQTNIDYIEKYSLIAVKKMNEHGIPASITLAQGILESGAGKSELAQKSNNHFGIKCHNDWSGERVYHDDDKKGECFRKYKRPEDSYEDHSNFLKRPRYEKLFQLKTTDYKGWAKGLKECGYATAPDYAQKLIGLIETYELYKYDNGEIQVEEKILPNENNIIAPRTEYLTESTMGIIPAYRTHKVISSEGRKAVIAESGDSYYSIAEEFDLRKWQIRRYNKLKRKNRIQPSAGDTIFISK